jgi:hypothetical protein
LKSTADVLAMGLHALKMARMDGRAGPVRHVARDHPHVATRATRHIISRGPEIAGCVAITSYTPPTFCMDPKLSDAPQTRATRHNIARGREIVRRATNILRGPEIVGRAANTSDAPPTFRVDPK